jgi:hypothetical protein
MASSGAVSDRGRQFGVLCCDVQSLMASRHSGQDDEAGAEEDPFEALAALLRAPATLSAAGGLLRRLEARRAASAASGIHKRRRRAPASSAGGIGSGGIGKHDSIPAIGGSDASVAAAAGKERDAVVAAAQAALFPKSHRAGRSIPRYAPRVFLASYMIRVRQVLGSVPNITLPHCVGRNVPFGSRGVDPMQNPCWRHLLWRPALQSPPHACHDAHAACLAVSLGSPQDVVTM